MGREWLASFPDPFTLWERAPVRTEQEIGSHSRPGRCEQNHFMSALEIGSTFLGRSPNKSHMKINAITVNL